MKRELKFILCLFKLIYGIGFFLITFSLIIQLYGVTRLGIRFIKGEYFILKYSLTNPLVNAFDTINYLWLNYLRYQKDGYFPIISALAISIIISVFLIINKKSNKDNPNNKKVTRGPKLRTAKQLNKDFKKTVEQEVNEIYKDLPNNEKRCFSKRKLIKKFMGEPFNCSSNDAKVNIPSFVLERHVALIGATGVGKSTEIKHLIDYTNSQREKSIIIDINGEIYSEIGRENDIILSPHDSRSHKWDFCFEKSHGKPINPSEFAKYIVPKGGEQNSFWWKGGRTVFSELLENYNSSQKLWNAITDQSRDFRNHLSGIVNNIIGKAGSSQDAGIIGTLSSDLGFLKSIIKLNNFSKKDFFSIAKWAQDKSNNNIFIIFSDKDFESISPIVRIWLNLAILGRYEAGKDNNLPKMNIIADEIGDLGKLEKLPSALARLRKYGGKVTIGLQSEGQLLNIYGRDNAKAMKGNIGTRFIFRTPEEEEAKNLSKFLGRSEVISVSKNTNRDKSGKSYTSKSESTSYKDIVLDSEIRELADGHFYLKSLNLSPARLRIRKKRWKSVNGPHQMKSINEKSSKDRKNNKSEHFKFYNKENNVNSKAY